MPPWWILAKSTAGLLLALAEFCCLLVALAALSIMAYQLTFSPLGGASLPVGALAEAGGLAAAGAYACVAGYARGL